MNPNPSGSPTSPFLQRLRGRITLKEIPFSERGSRLLIFRDGSHLSVRLAERWSQWEKEVGDYRHRGPVLKDFCVTDEHGTPVDFELTGYPHVLLLQTRLAEFWLAFVNEETLYLHLPSARLGVSFRVYATNGRLDRRGGEFKGDPAHLRTHRNVAYTTNARILSNSITPDEDGYLRVQLQIEADAGAALLLNITPRLGFNRSVPAAEQVLCHAEQRWHTWFAAAPPVEDRYATQYYYAWWVLRAGLLSPRFYLTREAMIPSKIHYVGVWAWDAFFHALAYRHVDHELAENQLRVLLDHQCDDGMIPDAVYDEGIVTRFKLPHSTQEAEVTKPPLIAWTALKLYATSCHRDFLEEIYEPIQRCHAWWLEKHDDDHDGIAQYNHPYSSGLDDCPLWDGGMPVESPDLSTYLVLQLDSLAQMATILNLPGDLARWRGEANSLMRKIITHFWDERAGIFWAMRDHQRIPTLTPFNLYPLITGRLDRAMSERLVAHLLSTDEFWTHYPLATVACRDPKYDPNQMWRGPAWMNINYLFIEGLLRSGYREQALLLRDKTLDLMLRQDDTYEFYNPETGKPPPHAASVFGWSSAVFVDLAIHASRGEII